MKRAIAHSRCEVGGEVYLPGDHITKVTKEQLEFLKSKGAVFEMEMASISPARLEPSDTVETADEKYHKLTGERRPRKGHEE